MEWRRSERVFIALTMILMPAALAGCDLGERGTDGPPDLPGPMAEQFREPGPVAPQVMPGPDQFDGIAVEPFGDFVVSARYDADPLESHLALHHWNEEEERWGEAEPLPFSAPGLSEGTPALAPDASYIFFSSVRPTTNPAAGDMNIWVAQREDGENGEIAWTDPWLVPGVFSPAWDGAPSLAGDASLFFASERDGPETGRSLFVAPFEEGMWMAPQRLPEPVNSNAQESDPFIAPDRSYLLFSSNRDGAWALYVTHADGEGWGEPQRLPDEINGEGNNRAPWVTSAGSTLFWVRDGELMAAPTHAADLDLADDEESES